MVARLDGLGDAGAVIGLRQAARLIAPAAKPAPSSTISALAQSRLYARAQHTRSALRVGSHAVRCEGLMARQTPRVLSAVLSRLAGGGTLPVNTVLGIGVISRLVSISAPRVADQTRVPVCRRHELRLGQRPELDSRELAGCQRSRLGDRPRPPTSHRHGVHPRRTTTTTPPTRQPTTAHTPGIARDRTNIRCPPIAVLRAQYLHKDVCSAVPLRFK